MRGQYTGGMKTRLPIALAMLGLFSLAGCGQKGPLVMPPEGVAGDLPVPVEAELDEDAWDEGLDDGNPDPRR